MSSTRSVAAVVVLVLAGASCAGPGATASVPQAVIAGDPVDAEGSGHVLVRVQIPGLSHSALCSGELVTNEWVLTSRHCFSPTESLTDPPSSQVGISLQMGAQGGAGDLFFVDPGGNDVALVHSNVPFSMSGSFMGYHVAYYGFDPTNLVDQTVVCFGYGDNAWDSTGAGTLRQAVLTVADADSSQVEVSQNSGGQVGGHGDSGGPCFQLGEQSLLVGVISQDVDPDPSNPGQYLTTRTVFIGAVSTWVDAVTSGGSQAGLVGTAQTDGGMPGAPGTTMHGGCAVAAGRAGAARSSSARVLAAVVAALALVRRRRRA